MTPRSAGRALLITLVVAATLCWYPQQPRAETQEQRVSVGGYFRLMARPDFQGGNGKLGHWNLYGRLLNEGPWAALELRLLLLDGVLQVPLAPVHTPRLHAAAPTRLRPATDGPPEPRPCHSG